MPMVAETANGCLVLHNARTIVERHKRAPKNLKRLLYALLLSASGELLPLDEDLSWMSATRSNRQRNTELALRSYLATTENMDLVSLTPSSDPDAWLGKVSTWHAITSEKLKDLSGVNVKIPAQIRVQLDASGKVKKVDRTELSSSSRFGRIARPLRCRTQ
jgi:hypothetical protein